MKRLLIGWLFAAVMGVVGSAVLVSRIGAADSHETNVRGAAEPVRDDDRGNDRAGDRDGDRDRDDGDARGRERGEREMDRDGRERRHDMGARRRPGRDRERDRDHRNGPPHRSGNTVKLEFRLINEDDQPTFHVLVVAHEFAIEHEVSEPNGAHYIGFRGELIPIDDEGRLLLHYKVEMNHQNTAETQEASFEALGSAFLGMDKPAKLATLGQTVVQVTATIEK